MVFVPFLDFVQKIVSIPKRRTHLHFAVCGAQFWFDNKVRCPCNCMCNTNLKIGDIHLSVFTKKNWVLVAVKSDQQSPTLKLNYSIKLNQNNNDFLSHMSLNRKLEFLHQNISWATQPLTRHFFVSGLKIHFLSLQYFDKACVVMGP